ncbi:MAG: phenylalanine--tRNA ligase subunit beta [Mycoplasmoidaceae bacterium]
MYLSRKLITSFFPEFALFNDKKLIGIFNSLGIELETIFNFEKTNNLVVGEILETSKHPSADSLNVCKVRISSSKINTIVCGAKNVYPNQKVIVALKGAKLIDGRVIEYKELRGVLSEGMICAYNELTSRNDWCNKNELDDIVLLPSTAKVGDKNPFGFLNMDDIIYELSIPSNRNDLNSVFGIILEMQSFLNLKKELAFRNLNKKLNSKIKLKNNVSDNHYLISLKNEKYTKSNWIVKTLLMNSGFIPSDSIEDLGKLNQILSGIPVIAFTNIKGNKLEVSKLEKPTRVELNSYGIVNLKKGDIVLKNNNDIVALMNIDVCKKYAINQHSKNIYFLSCSTNPMDIKNTSNRLKLMNDKIKFSSKNISSWWYKKSLDIFIENLKPSFTNIEVDLKHKESKQSQIKLDLKKVNKLLGVNITDANIRKVINSFGYKIAKDYITIPEYRIDIENDHDIIEDILKVIGIQNIPELSIKNSILYNIKTKDSENITKVNNILLNRGFYLLKTYNLTSKKINDKFNYFKYNKPIQIKNPISSDREYMRLSLIDGILDCYSYNSSLKNDLVPVFEIQEIYYGTNKRKHLVAAVPEDIIINNFNNSIVKADIFFLKSIAQSIALVGKQELSFEKEISNSWGCKKDSIKVNLNKNNIGYITRISPEVLKSYKIKSEKIYLMELDVTNLIDFKNNLAFVFDDEKKHKIIRDLSVMVDKEYDLNNIYKLAKSCNLIESLKFISAFEKGDEISYTFRFNLISNDNDVKINFQKVIDFFIKNNLKIISS